uniref:Uncharacterized protein n=1 Tax=Zea mays TaxID=4577 RepID=B4FZS5_MAIZE|nr:unknown [Zea mays]
MEELLKPVDESQDLYKRQQLRELAMLNSTLREDSPHPGSVSPFSNGGMKRANQASRERFQALLHPPPLQSFLVQHQQGVPALEPALLRVVGACVRKKRYMHFAAAGRTGGRDEEEIAGR